MAGNGKIVPQFTEVSTLGFIADISAFTKALKIPIMPDDLKRYIVIAALKRNRKQSCLVLSVIIHTVWYQMDTIIHIYEL